MMSEIAVQDALRKLTIEALDGIERNQATIPKTLVIYGYNLANDDFISALPAFQPAVKALAEFSSKGSMFNSSQASEVAQRFIQNAWRRTKAGIAEKVA